MLFGFYLYMNERTLLQINRINTRICIGSNEKKGVKYLNHALSKRNLTNHQLHRTSTYVLYWVLKAIQLK